MQSNGCNRIRIEYKKSSSFRNWMYNGEIIYVNDVFFAESYCEQYQCLIKFVDDSSSAFVGYKNGDVVGEHDGKQLFCIRTLVSKNWLRNFFANKGITERQLLIADQLIALPQHLHQRFIYLISGREYHDIVPEIGFAGVHHQIGFFRPKLNANFVINQSVDVMTAVSLVCCLHWGTMTWG